MTSEQIEAIFRAVPYLVAAFLSVSRLSSRILEARHRGKQFPDTIEFAKKWTAAGDLIALPVLSLFFCLANGVRWFLRGSVSEGSAVGILSGMSVVMVALVIVALVVAAKGVNEMSTGWIAIVKVTAIMFFWAIDFFVFKV